MRNRGNVFIIIVAVLGIIFTMATFFMQSTIEEKGQTEYSLRGVQAQCLAEAAMERAVRLLNQEMNDPEKAKDKTTIAGKLRQPLTVAGATTGPKTDMGSTLGQDEPLTIPADLQELTTMTKDDLQKETKEIDEMVKYMVGDAQGVQYEVKVKVGMNTAYRVAPGPSVEDATYKYLVPGVDIPWSIHPLVKGFLENQGFVALRMRFPEGWKWLQFIIPIKIGELTLYEIDLVEILEKISPDVKQFTQYLEVHTLFAALFPSFYPYDIVFAKDVFPQVADKLGATPPALDPKKPMEKYGFMGLESEATITYPDKKKVTRLISATKEFKCADIQPVAPLFSFFVANRADEMLNFNDVGGNIYINNFASFGAVKNGPGADNKEKFEFPGLIRFNGTKPMVCNVSFMGNPMGPTLSSGDGDSFLTKIGRGAEVAIMMDLGCEMDGIDSLGDVNGNMVAYVPKKYQDKYSDKLGTAVSWTEHAANPKEGGKLIGGGTDTTPGGDTPDSLKPSDAAVEKNKKTSTTGDTSVDSGSSQAMTDRIKDKLKGLLPGMPEINVLPPITVGISILGIPMHLFDRLDPWARWEWPMMGMGWRMFRIPNTGVGQNVTHLFGSGGLFPPMTRSVEGFVLKKYRQWNLGVVGWPLGPYPLVGNQIIVPFIPVPIPPVPIPLWHTHDIVNKYDYNLWLLKTPKDKDGSEGDEDVVTYDPAIQENCPPNLYSIEQYAKKATYYYSSQADFYKDLPNRCIKDGETSVLRLNGITFIADSLVIPPVGSGTLKVSGKGAIVVGGNIILTGSIEDTYSDEQERTKDAKRTIFSLIARQGGLIFDSNSSAKWAKIEGSVYTHKGIAVPKDKGLKIVGNWITNSFNKAYSSGDIMVEYVGYKTRSSLFSLHPDYGKYDADRYLVTLSPTWDSWKVK